MSVPTSIEELKDWEEVLEMLERPLRECVTKASEMLREMQLPADDTALLEALADKTRVWRPAQRRRAQRVLQLLVWVRQTRERLPHYSVEAVGVAHAALMTGVIAANLGLSLVESAKQRANAKKRRSDDELPAEVTKYLRLHPDATNADLAEVFKGRFGSETAKDPRRALEEKIRRIRAQ